MAVHAGHQNSFQNMGPRNEQFYENPIEWNSHTGVDMTAGFRFNNESYDYRTDQDVPIWRVFAELQTVSISATRTVHPVRALGESAARVYTRGARTFAGTLIFTMFNKDPLEEVARLDPDHEVFNTREPFVIDQIPEFDISITSVNEFGSVSRAVIGGVTLTNYGTTLSIHDIYTEISYTYVARFYVPMTADIRMFDRIRQMILEPTPKSASDLASKRTNSQLPTTEEQKAAEFLEKYPPGSDTGRLLRNLGPVE